MRTDIFIEISPLEYHNLFAESHQHLEDGYNSILEQVKRFALRDCLLSLASSPEAFLFLRKEYAYSVACISIFGYILGIGDRHLENALLDMKRYYENQIFHNYNVSNLTIIVVV
jgi:phosphatidylinositol kinase/protein kinase (PI-3  family)